MVTGNIENMYRQILIDPSQRCCRVAKLMRLLLFVRAVSERCLREVFTRAVASDSVPRRFLRNAVPLIVCGEFSEWKTAFSPDPVGGTNARPVSTGNSWGKDREVTNVHL